MTLRVLLGAGVCALVFGSSAGWFPSSALAARAAQPGPAKKASAAPALSDQFRRDLPDPPPGTLPDDYVILRINDRSIGAREFVDSYFSAYAADRPNQDSLGRVDFMKSLIHRELLSREAKRIDKPTTFEDRLQLRDFSARIYSNLLYRRTVVDRIHVDEAQVKSAYELFKAEVRLRQMLFPGQELAEKVRRDLLAGRIGWSAAVRRFSTSDPENDGDIGWQSAGQIGLLFAVHTHRLKPGEYSPLIKTHDGWVLFQCMERREVRPPAFEGMARLIRGQLETLQSNQLADALQDSLVAQIGLTVDTTNVRWASSYFKRTSEYVDGALNIDASVPEFGPGDTSRVLVRFRGGQLTLGTFLHEYTNIPPMLRPTINESGLLKSQAIATALEPYNVKLAIERGIDRDPDAIRQVEKKREELLVEHLYEDSVASGISVDPGEMRRFYEKNKHQFVSIPSVRFAAITRPTRAGIDSVAARIRAGESPVAILRADSLAGYVSGSVKERRMNDQGQPYHKLLFEELRPGQFSIDGPDSHGDYLLLHILTRDDGQQFSFEESRGWVEEALMNTAAEAKLNAFLSRIARRFEIHWRPDLVMRTDFRMRDDS